MKNYADLGGCYPPQPSASADNTLLDLHNSSYHTQPHPIIANYSLVTVQKTCCGYSTNAFIALHTYVNRGGVQWDGVQCSALVCGMLFDALTAFLAKIRDSA